MGSSRDLWAIGVFGIFGGAYSLRGSGSPNRSRPRPDVTDAVHVSKACGKES